MRRMRMHESYMYILFQLKVLREVLFAENILRCAITLMREKWQGVQGGRRVAKVR